MIKLCLNFTRFRVFTFDYWVVRSNVSWVVSIKSVYFRLKINRFY